MSVFWNIRIELKQTFSGTYGRVRRERYHLIATSSNGEVREYLKTYSLRMDAEHDLLFFVPPPHLWRLAERGRRSEEPPDPFWVKEDF